MEAPQYVCPDCGCLILNRAYPKCERCQAVLPAELMFSKAEADKRWDALMAERQKGDDEKFRDSLHVRGVGDGNSIIGPLV